MFKITVQLKHLTKRFGMYALNLHTKKKSHKYALVGYIVL